MPGKVKRMLEAEKGNVMFKLDSSPVSTGRHPHIVIMPRNSIRLRKLCIYPVIRIYGVVVDEEWEIGKGLDAMCCCQD